MENKRRNILVSKALKTNSDYTNINNYLEKLFIPRFMELKHYKNYETNEIEVYPSIKLKYISSLDYNEEDMNHVFLYLYSIGVLIDGKNPMNFYNNQEYFKNLKNFEKINLNQFYYDINNRHRNKETLIADYMNMVKYIAYRMSKITGLSYQDLEGYGYEGLMLYINNYEPFQTSIFETGLYNYIKNKMLDNVPELLGFRRNKFFSDFLKYKLLVEEEFDINLEDNLDYVHIIIDEMVKNNCISKNYATANKGRVWMQYHDSLDQFDIISEEDSFEETLEKELLRNINAFLKEELTSNQQKVIEYFYGLKDGKCYNQYEIADILNLSRERIRQLKSASLERLRNPERIRRLTNKVGEHDNIPSHYIKNVNYGNKL